MNTTGSVRVYNRYRLFSKIACTTQLHIIID